MTPVGVRLLRAVVFGVVLLTSLAQGERRPAQGSGQGECGNQQVVEVRPGQEQWLVSPGHVWPGIANGSQDTCLWTVKAPPGHGVVVELVRLRLHRSRRCSATRLEVKPAGSVTSPRTRPLAKFCGRQTRLWKTTFSEITIEYKRSKGRGQQTTLSGPQSGSREGNAAKSSKSKSAQDRADRLNRIKALHRLYQHKTRQNREHLRSRNEQHQSDSRYYPHRRDDYSSSRRFYRHLNDLNDDTTQIENDLLINGDHFIYDLESNTYGVTTINHNSLSVRLIGVGEPASFNSEFITLGGVNNTEPSLEHYLEDLTLNKNSTYQMRHNSTNAHSIQGVSNHVEESGKESIQRYKRSPRVSSEAHGRHTPRETRRRPPQYTDNDRSRSPNRQQYRVPSRRRKNSQPSAASRRDLYSSNPHFRNRNEIIPNKPAKPSHHRLKKYEFKGPEVTTETHGRKGRHQRPGGSRRWRKKEYFVLKVTAFRSGCGGEVDDAVGRFTSPDYPHKTSEKGSCSWRFKTPMRSHWKLTCENFLIRRSRDCRRDHLAIKINDAHWSRYCGREGPSLALTSSHHATVDVVLNTFRNRSARVMCTWETSAIDGRSSHRHQAYDSYWSYNLTVATTTTTTTTTTTPPPPKVPQTRSCQDYTRLSHEHTMCSSTPSSCAIYQDGVISSDRQMIIDSHNVYRAKVARGEESKGLPGPQYSAADMQQLAWNEELAQVAQAWASSCPNYHDCHDCRKLLSRSYYVGQNIFYEWSSTDGGSVWDTAIRLWYEEVQYVPNYLTKSYRSMDHAVIGHYTQLVWAETREIGCGAAYHDCSKVFKGRSWKLKCKIYVCNYGPTGNFLSKPMYTIGPPASACPKGSYPSAQYPGLCTSH